MNDTQHAGAVYGLNINIERKVFRSTSAQEKTVIDGFKASVPAGSFVSLVGPSGCGKTTILRIIAGLDQDFSGTIEFTATDDPPLDDLPLPRIGGTGANGTGANSLGADGGGEAGGGKMAARPHCGFVFQDPNLLPWRTVAQNIALAARDDLPSGELQQLLAEASITDCLDLYPRELSLGIARRVSIVRALASRPSLLLLDEPFVSLDDDTAARAKHLVARLWQARPITTLLVTHSLQEAVELSDRVIALSDSPTSVLGRHDIELPRHQRTRQFVDDRVAAIRDTSAERQAR